MSPEKTSKLSEISCDAPPKARFNSINNPIGNTTAITITPQAGGNYAVAANLIIKKS